MVFRLSDPRIDEASGIGVGIRSPGVVYVHNDSGDSARFFALDGTTGRPLTVFYVPDATNVDWEDLAVARDASGVASVWLADIGDNDAKRSEVRIYRVDEPAVEPSASGSTRTTAEPQVWRLRYPSGPVNAESLAVAPGGAAYIVTKSVFGDSAVYAVPATPDPNRVQTLRQIGSIAFSITGSPDPFAPIGEVTATGAALSRDGSLLTVRTYSDAYFWRVSHGAVAAALRTEARRIALPRQPQGEGIAFAGARVLTDSEKVGSAVYSVPLPAGLIVAAAPRPTPGRSTPKATSASAARPSPRGAAYGPAAVAAGAIVLAGVLWAGVSRRRRTRALRSANAPAKII